MSSAETDTAPTAQALALLELPGLDGLTEDQVRGTPCVWDSSENPLAEDQAVDLGPRRKGRLDGEYDWHPPGCPEHVSRASHQDHCVSGLLRVQARADPDRPVLDTALAPAAAA